MRVSGGDERGAVVVEWSHPIRTGEMPSYVTSWLKSSFSLWLFRYWSVQADAARILIIWDKFTHPFDSKVRSVSDSDIFTDAPCDLNFAIETVKRS